VRRTSPTKGPEGNSPSYSLPSTTFGDPDGPLVTWSNNHSPDGVLVPEQRQADFFLVVDRSRPDLSRRLLRGRAQAEFVLTAYIPWSTEGTAKCAQSSPMNLSNPKTKIVATIGPASSSVNVLREMLAQAWTSARLNFSHGSYEFYTEVIANIRELNEELGLTTAILADLQGPKLRVGEMARRPIDGARAVNWSSPPRR
jgi:hypothetical protein